MIAAVVAWTIGRAVCLAFRRRDAPMGVPEEVLTDNGKQFTHRFGKIPTSEVDPRRLHGD